MRIAKNKKLGCVRALRLYLNILSGELDKVHVFRGDIWLADLGQPIGSEAGFVRPVIIVQADALNQSRLESYIAIPLTSKETRASARWNALLPARATGLDRDSIAQTNLIVTVPQGRMLERIGSVDDSRLDDVFAGLDIALGRR